MCLSYYACDTYSVGTPNMRRGSDSGSVHYRSCLHHGIMWCLLKLCEVDYRLICDVFPHIHSVPDARQAHYSQITAALERCSGPKYSRLTNTQIWRRNTVCSFVCIRCVTMLASPICGKSLWPIMQIYIYIYIYLWNKSTNENETRWFDWHATFSVSRHATCSVSHFRVVPRLFLIIFKHVWGKRWRPWSFVFSGHVICTNALTDTWWLAS